MPNEQSDNYSIIAHTNKAQVLLLQEEGGWTLPRHTFTNPGEINAATYAQFGLTTTVLACVYDCYRDEERDAQGRVYALENHSPDVPLPANARWIDLSELANLPLLVPEHRPVLEAWLNKAENGALREQQVAWENLGWFDTASSWIEEQLDRMGYRAGDGASDQRAGDGEHRPYGGADDDSTQSAPFEQVRTNFWATTLRLPTTRGNLYFKAMAPLFAFEPILTQNLSRLVPNNVPHVLMIDRERHWMLMQEGGVPFRSGPCDPNRSIEAVRQYARLQMALAPHIETLKASGCPDHRLHRLPHLYDEVLAATQFLLIDEPKGLPRSEYEQLLAYKPQLQAMCDELASYNIPESLEHDDLHTGNILVNGERYIFFDWGDSCLAHPFAAMFIVLRDAKYRLEYDEKDIERIRQAYLACWTEFEPMERLERVFTLAHRLGSLYRALTWYRLEPYAPPEVRQMFEESVPYFLRVFLGTEE